MVQLTAGYGNRGVKATRKSSFVFPELDRRRLNVTQLGPDRCLSSGPSNKIKSLLRKPRGNQPTAAPGMPPRFLKNEYVSFI